MLERAGAQSGGRWFETYAIFTNHAVCYLVVVWMALL